MSEVTLESIQEKFMHTSPREGQLEAVKFIIDAFASGKKYVIIEAPTGAGKSVIGMTVAQFYNDVYYLTIQKLLQTQLVNEFGHKKDDPLVPLMGRNAYPCTIYERCGQRMLDNKTVSKKELKKLGVSWAGGEKEDIPGCDVGFCRTKLSSKKCLDCFTSDVENGGVKNGRLEVLPPNMKYSACPYFEQVAVAQKSRFVTMNYSSFLAQVHYAMRFGVRDLMICDEAHNIQSVIMDFVSVVLSDFKLKHYGIIIPELYEPKDYCEWLDEIDIISVLDRLIGVATGENDFKTADEMEDLKAKIQMFKVSITESDDEWICEYKRSTGNTKYNTVTLKPIFVRRHTNDLIFGCADRVLLMSATILNLDTFCDVHGIDRKDAASYRMRNRIPVNRRPIISIPTAEAKGGSKNMPNWMPKMMRRIDQLCDKHIDYRGIIHTHNFAIADYIKEHSKHSDRLLYQKNIPNKDILLAEHAESENGIILAPAMHEGLDLKGDLSRFQIICKVPFPNYFDDKQLSKRAEIDWDYILWLTALKLIQSTGRSVRGVDDWAITYVIDDSFLRFMNNAKHMIPPWFAEAVSKKEL